MVTREPARKPSRKIVKEDQEEIFTATTDDWPIGPPGYGFPKEIADLDGILVRATGDGGK